MNGLTMYLADGTYDGAITMESLVSKFKAVRVDRRDVPKYFADLNAPGIYLLMVDGDSVYVGQSGFDTVGKRIMKPHAGTIDKNWHTVFGFMTATNISSNELLYIENAMCEYVYNHYPKCLTTSPSKKNCNAAYRQTHYHLSSSQIHACDQYIEDIQFFIEKIPVSIFPSAHRKAMPATVGIDTFYFKNAKRDVDGIAEIQIHLGHQKKRTTILKAGSRISTAVSGSFASSKKSLPFGSSLKIMGRL